MVNDQHYGRRWLLVILLALVVFIYIIRLFYLQILSPGYKDRADNNAYYHKAIHPSRGVIYDRNGQLLVGNRPAYDLMITMHETKGRLDTLTLASLLGLSKEELSIKLEEIKDRRRNRGYTPYTP